MRVFSLVLMVWNIISIFTTIWQFYQGEISFGLFCLGESINILFVLATFQIAVYAKINRLVIYSTPILLAWYLYYIFQDLAALNDFTGWRELLQVWFVMIDSSSITFLFVMLNIIYIHIHDMFMNPNYSEKFKNLANSIFAFCKITSRISGVV